MSTTKDNHDLRNFLILAICTILLGLSLIIWTDQAIRIICLVAGIGMMIWGLVEIIMYFSGNNTSVFRRGLVSGVLAAGFGLLCLLQPTETGNRLGILIGIGMLVDALFKLQCGLNLMRFKSRFGWLVTLFGAIVLVLACLIIAIPKMALVLVGVQLLIDGLMDLTVLILLRRFQKGLDIVSAKAVRADAEENAPSAEEVNEAAQESAAEK